MSALQERAVRMIGQLDDRSVFYVIEYMKSLPAAGEAQEMDSVRAFKELEEIIGGFPEDFDYGQELEEALGEKYGRID